MRHRLGVGIVGIGWVAVEHLRAFSCNPDVSLAMLCTRDEARARRRLKAARVDVGAARSGCH